MTFTLANMWTSTEKDRNKYFIIIPTLVVGKEGGVWNIALMWIAWGLLVEFTGKPEEDRLLEALKNASEKRHGQHHQKRG